jgi:hypothetical protein
MLRKVSALIAVATSSLLLSPAVAPAQGPVHTCDPISVIGMGVARVKGISPRLVVAGNFHTSPTEQIAAAGPAESKKLRDLAYVSTMIVQVDGGTTRSKHVLNVLLSNGEGCFRAPIAPQTGLPDVLVGDEPTLIAAADFNGDGHEDIAIIDTRMDVDFNRSAKLRIFIGDGAGHFAPGPGVSIFPLPEDRKPVAMALGRFRGPSMPVDIAVASVPTRPDATERGQLTLLRNDGSGKFSIAPPPISLGSFEPAAMLSSDRFRRERRYDLVIKEVIRNPSSQRRILYLKNSGAGAFPEIAVLTGAGEVDKLLVGPLNLADDADGDLDLITFNRDMTFAISKNHGEGGFNPATRVTPPVSNFEFAGGAQFGVAASDDGSLHLITAARRRSDKRLGTLLLKDDGPGHVALNFSPFRDLSTGPETNVHEYLEPLGSIDSSLDLNTPRKELQISEGLVDRFYAAQHGNGKPDLVLSARHVTRESRLGACSSLIRGPRISRRLGPAGATCINEIHCGLQDDEPAVCETPPVFDRCWCKCAEEPPPPPPPGCEIVKEFRPMFISVGNPFGPN